MKPNSKPLNASLLAALLAASVTALVPGVTAGTDCTSFTTAILPVQEGVEIAGVVHPAEKVAFLVNVPPTLSEQFTLSVDSPGTPNNAAASLDVYKVTANEGVPHLDCGADTYDNVSASVGNPATTTHAAQGADSDSLPTFAGYYLLVVSWRAGSISTPMAEVPVAFSIEGIPS